MRLRPDADVSAADWWDTAKDGHAPAAVGFLVPRGYEAYARILHPATRHDGAGTAVTWARVAEERGTSMHPEAQWWRIAGRAHPVDRSKGWPGEDPDRGVLERSRFAALAGVLARHTSTPERTLVAFWVGYGGWPAAWQDAPTTRRPVRESYLFERAAGDVPALCRDAADGPSWQTPSAWWPADHAWVTSTDTDLDSTLVGGTRALVGDLLAEAALEVVPWPVGGSLWSDADTVNR